MEDELRVEYDLKSLRVRKFGSERKNFYDTNVRLEFDVQLRVKEKLYDCTGGTPVLQR